ncbi:MAG: hypothetical protein NZ846_11445, partial [Thermus sp.]|nr:hypothetical protein [Thermus sp.]
MSLPRGFPFPQGRPQGPLALPRAVDGSTVEPRGLGPAGPMGIDPPGSRPSLRASEGGVQPGFGAKASLVRLPGGKGVWAGLDLGPLWAGPPPPLPGGPEGGL